ncbi:transposase family protein, partial [Enterococcus cecorum]|uniref:transposase family protein n=1 Tax=Enterococcus cecorum TaxID=44008 RepID=UPI003BB71727
MPHLYLISTRSKIDTFIKNIFNIKDDNITFPTYTDALSEEEVHGVPSKVFSGLLSYPENPYCCPKCGVVGSVIKHTPKASLIQMIPFQNVPTYLRLYKQRYRCK